MPVPVIPYLDDKFIEIQNSGNRLQTTNYTSTYAGNTNTFNDNNGAGQVTGMLLWTKPEGGNTLVCSGLLTTYNGYPRNDTYHGAPTNMVSSFERNDNTPRVYRIIGFKDRGANLAFISGLKVDWTSGRDSGSIVCGPTHPEHRLERVDLTPRHHGSCMLYNVAGTVDNTDGGLIRSLDLSWDCHY